MANGILGISLTGLNAAQAGIRTTEHNIANANTTGYRRQQVDMAAADPAAIGSGFLGNGVSVEAVRSQYSQFLDNEVLLNQSRLARHQSYSDRAAHIDKLLGDKNSGLSAAMDTFFNATSEVANDPTSNAARQVLLSAGNSLAGRLNAIDNKLRDLRTTTNGEIGSVVSRINSLASQIAQVNTEISRSEAGTGQPANDLRDQRDLLIAQLNKLVNVTQLQHADGSTSLFVGNGQPLVVNGQANAMGTAIDIDDNAWTVPTLNVGGSVIPLNAGHITGGELGGTLAMRDEMLKPAIDDINRMAVALGLEVNRVHGGGLDYNLNAGGAFFTDPVTAAAGSTGVVSIALGNDLELTNDSYTLAFDGANYTLTRHLADGSSVVTAGSPGGLAAVTAGHGFSLGVTTPPVAGDSWDINLKGYAHSMRMVVASTDRIAAARATADGPGDNGNAVALAALRTTTLLNNGSATFATGYNGLVTRTASLAAAADLDRTAYATLTSQSEILQRSMSGVNLDEEAVNLLRYQQAYQASAKAMQVSTTLFESLMGIVR